MSAATPRRISTSTHLALLAALAGAVYLHAPRGAVGATPPAASAPAGAGATAGPVLHGIPVSAYAWPTQVSKEPGEEEWAGALELSNPPAGVQPIACTQRALGAWLRITCTPPPHVGPEDPLFGSLWGLAGDVAKVKGSFVLASEVEPYKTLQADRVNDVVRKMGASATITLPLAPGSALLLRLDEIQWEFGYEDSAVGTRPGLSVDISWALGEKHPTILYM